MDAVAWTLALAGGEGVRLADYVERRFGRRIPKQYCPLLGRRTMIQHTLDRMNQIAPPSRTLTVVAEQHFAMAMRQLHGRCDHVFCQHESRDTGVAVYVALAMIKRWAPNAIIAITPTDHYVAPAATYIEHVRAARQVAVRMPDRIVILGARPSEPDPDFGYVCLGTLASQIPRTSRVVQFVEKPPRAVATQLVARGALWNTMVTCATLHALWDAGRETAADLMDFLDELVPAIGTAAEDAAIDHTYRHARHVNFSSDMLERVPDRLVAFELHGVEWSDWGRPERVEAVLAARRHDVVKHDDAG